MIEPYKIDPDKSPHENASAFLSWLVQSVHEIHAKTEDALKYQRATYEMVYRLTQARSAMVPQQQVAMRSPKTSKILRDLQGFVIGNQDLVIRMMRALWGK